jgi:hypothetical protein
LEKRKIANSASRGEISAKSARKQPIRAPYRTGGVAVHRFVMPLA